MTDIQQKPEDVENNDISDDVSEESTIEELNTELPSLEEALQQISVLSEKLEKEEAKSSEAQDKMLRALAEVENMRRRTERERQDTAKFAVSGIAKDLLSVADNLLRALEAISEDERAANEQLNSIFIGVEATERELQRAFEKNGIKKIEAMGKIFDPNKHEVLFEAPADGKPAGTIVQVIDTGYTIHDRLLRPSRVGVVKGDDSLKAGSTLDEQA